MKKTVIVFLLIVIFILVSCNNKSISNHINQSDNIKEEDEMNMNKLLTLKINNQEIDVTWFDNDSVKALKELAKDDLTINMHKYSTFEQVGSLGKSIISSDIEITTSPGDIVLYSSSNIVLFYGSNTWDYTKLGHINLNKTELTELLGKDDVTISFSLK